MSDIFLYLEIIFACISLFLFPVYIAQPERWARDDIANAGIFFASLSILSFVSYALCRVMELQ